VIVLHDMKYRTVMIDGGLGLMWKIELNNSNNNNNNNTNKNIY